MAETTKTFLELIKDYKIIIPLIQRDYAQGREKEINKAEKFLKAIKNGCASKLNLDFVYGERDEVNKIFIPLDGQQRLTTLFLIHWYLSLCNCHIPELSKFSYEVRNSSKDFLEALTKHDNWGKFSKKNIKSQIENSNWFFISWKNDLTIVSLLNMLDLIEMFFENEEINNLNNITFEILYLDEFKLTDELYVKMNARGKPLTLFENFKAEFENYIEKTGDTPEFIAKNKASFDNEWLNIFWNLAKNKIESEQKNIEEAPKLADEMFYNFFYNMTFNFYLEKQDKFIKINNKEYSIINEFIKDNDIFSFYKDVYSDTNKTTVIINILNKLQIDETFKTFVNNIEISQWDRARFHALYLAYINDLKPNDIEFKRWQRVSFNLINNQLIQSPDDLIKTIQSLNNLIVHSKKNIYQYISANYNAINYFTEIQREEESLKANLILEEENWEIELIKAEKHFYLDGQIKFLLDYSNKDLEKFKIYRETFFKLWELAKDNSNFIQRALLSEYDYTHLNSREHVGKYSLCSFGLALREKNENWRKVFKENEFKLFLDKFIENDYSLLEIIKNYKFDCNDWKSFIINPKYEWDIINEIKNGHFQIKNENTIFINAGNTVSTSWSWSRVSELKNLYTYQYLKNNSFEIFIKGKFNQDIKLEYYSSSEIENICFYFIIKYNNKDLGIDIKFDTMKNKYLFKTYFITPYKELKESELNIKLDDIKKIEELKNEIINIINNLYKI